MPSMQLLPLAAILFASSATVAIAKENSTSSADIECPNPSGSPELHQVGAHPNVTASYSRPSFHPQQNGSFPLSNWTYNTAIYVDQYELVTQEFWIETPNLRGFNSSEVPFSICTIAFEGLPKDVYSKGQNDTGDCLSTLNQDCVKAINHFVGNSSDGDPAVQCSDIMYKMSDYETSLPECRQFGFLGGDAMTSTFTGPKEVDGTADGQKVCDVNSNNTVHSLRGIGWDNHDTAPGFNQTAYDEATYRVIPLLTIAMFNESVPDQFGRLAGRIFHHDSNLICMRAKDVQAGSRIPPALPSPSTGAPAKSSAIVGRDATLGGVVALALMIMLLG